MRTIGYWAILAVTCLLAFAAGVRAHAQSAPASPVHFSASVEKPEHRRGEIALIAIDAKIARGWHLYSLVPTPPPGPTPTSIAIPLVAKGISEVGLPSEDMPRGGVDPNFGKSVSYHLDSAMFVVPARIAVDAGAAPIPIPITIHYQVCNDRVCLPPTETTLAALLTVAPGAARPIYTRMPPNAKAYEPLSAAAPTPSAQAGGGLAGFAAAAFIAGLLALLTPCVFPLIPVTFGFFTKQVSGDRRRLIGLAGIYAIGIIVSFTVLGLIAALVFGAAGANRVAANPWFNLFFGLLFVVFAFSFFESFLITLPPALSGLSRPFSGASGLTGVLFMGLAFVFAAFTCTAPFIGTVLVAAASATGAQWVRPLIGMLCFSLALALPFFLLALFPSLLTRLPRSGGWLTRFKATLGFVEIAYALTYFSKADLVWQAHILTAPVILALWACTAIACALYLLGLLRVSAYPEEPSKPSAWAVVFAIGFAGAGIYCLYGLTGRPVSGLLLAYLPPAGYGGTAISASSGPSDPNAWLVSYDKGIEQAKATGKPVFIDFTGYTCTNCRYVEQNIFTKSPVKELLSDRFTLVRLYTDGGASGPANQSLQQKMFGTVALPLYAIVSPDGQVVSHLAGSGNSLMQFADFMTSGLQTASATVSAVTQSASAWQPFSAAAVAGAHASNRPIIIDFTASWCTNCHALERTVFTDPQVAAKLGEFTTLRSDVTDFYSPGNTALEKEYNVTQLPAVLFLDATGKEVPATRVTGLVSASDFAARMAKAEGLGG